MFESMSWQIVVIFSVLMVSLTYLLSHAGTLLDDLVFWGFFLICCVWPWFAREFAAGYLEEDEPECRSTMCDTKTFLA